MTEPFSVIYADPPWFYNDRRNTHTRFCGGAMVHYPVMKTAELAALPVADIAAKDAMLFMWATWPTLPDAIEVMKGWGFRYVTAAFVWVKINRQNGEPFFGIGYYSKSNSEPVLLGVRGKPSVASNGVSQILEAPETVVYPRTRHSAKPPLVRTRIEALCGDVPRCELFSRDHLPGWTMIGNEITGRDLHEDLAILKWEIALSKGLEVPA